MQESPYEIKLSLNILNHLGLNLYSNVPAVLAEVVANSWDADADHVWININSASDEISITDDGCGMDLTDINNRYLTVGYRRREEDGESGKITVKWKRQVMGRKGIGKLSLFSIAREVQVFSVKNGQQNAFRMNLSDIQERIKSGEGTYRPPAIHIEEFPHDLKLGTRIILRDLKKKQYRTASSLRVRLARRFSILGVEHNFELFIDGRPVTVLDRGYFGRLQYIWYYGEQGQRARELANKVDHNDPRASEIIVKWKPDDDPLTYKIEGWIGTVHDSGDLKDDEENLNKIVIMVRGKLAQEDILEEFSEGRLVTKYMIGEIHADFLDLDERDDSATSSRQKIMEDDARYIALKEFIHIEVKNIANKWTELRDEEGKDKALEIPAIKDWFGDLNPDLRRKAKSLFGKINRLPLDKSDDRKRLFGYAVLAFENLRYKGNLDALDTMTPENIEGITSVFSELEDVEATLYHQVLKLRIEAIEALEEKVEDSAREKLIQKHLYSNLWLLDPAWERATDTEYMEKQVASEFQTIADSMTEEEKRGRYDIKYKKNSGKHVVIELKKADRLLSQGELIDQGQKYISALQKILEKLKRGNEPIEVIFLLGRFPKGWDNQRQREKGERSLTELSMRVQLYHELLDNAYKAYKEFIDKRREAGRLSRLLESIETADF